ncbi:hypothetical protein F4778DRAFT_444593 [Xylariomycetidae sp. FL2044]|nr:hypothetical protein F4778DRAFT_444593 [Xylariomycetidae sp. FL2044]
MRVTYQMPSATFTPPTYHVRSYILLLFLPHAALIDTCIPRYIYIHLHISPIVQPARQDAHHVRTTCLHPGRLGVRQSSMHLHMKETMNMNKSFSWTRTMLAFTRGKKKVTKGPGRSGSKKKDPNKDPWLSWSPELLFYICILLFLMCVHDSSSTTTTSRPLHSYIHTFRSYFLHRLSLPPCPSPSPSRGLGYSHISPLPPRPRPLVPANT